ncbi:MAG: peroxiredoxin-like family protein [Candidatus Limnocylindria bacterium]
MGLDRHLPRPHGPDAPDTEAAGREWLEHWRVGPTRTRWTELPVQPGDGAPTLDLVAARSGRVVPLSSVWAAGPALLLFWRHFGCSCGRDRAARLRDEYAAYVSAGATVALVGQGESSRALTYAEANGLPAEMPLLCDPDERAYRAYGLLEGGPAEVLFDAPDDYLRCEPRAGMDLFEQRRAQGTPMVDNPWLLPGEFVVDPGGRLVSAYRFQFCEHWIDPRVNVAAIRHASGELRPTFG